MTQSYPDASRRRVSGVLGPDGRDPTCRHDTKGVAFGAGRQLRAGLGPCFHGRSNRTRYPFNYSITITCTILKRIAYLNGFGLRAAEMRSRSRIALDRKPSTTSFVQFANTESQMDIALHIPESIAAKLKEHWHDVDRRAMEALVAEAYRAGILTTSEVRQALGFGSRWETDAFLKRAEAYLDYTEADLEADIQAIRSMLVH